MDRGPAIILVLNAHLPFVASGFSPEEGGGNGGRKSRGGAFSRGERWLFESLSETYLPLCRLFDRLEGDHVPFRAAVSLSPVFCSLLRDEFLRERYLEYVDRQIEFGLRELERSRDNPRRWSLIKFFYDHAVDKRFLFTERYQADILRPLDYYRRRGRLEFLLTAATYSFLPFYAGRPEAVQAQIETAIISHRSLFGKIPQGFWLPELGWAPELDRHLRSYNFGYTIVDSHSLAVGRASRGSFYPLRTSGGVMALGRDFYACRDLDREGADPLYRDPRRDSGYELPAEMVRPFLDARGRRTATGYQYWDQGGDIYRADEALRRARERARLFLDHQAARLEEAAARLETLPPCSVWACNADSFGKLWYEGTDFLEALFREAAGRRDLRFMTPSEYLCQQEAAGFETAAPEYSSWGSRGYAETWLDASNDWIYRHIFRAQERMTELSERFPNETGIRERALNQAAREVLLAQSADWPRLLAAKESAPYARSHVEGALRNFTTIYEALGSKYISTEWLTALESRHRLFPAINYRVFRRKV